MKIYLVRHAEKEHEGEDANLTKKGISQANLLGKK
ncbi:MAG: histidine phosphatase family protein, partial [Nanoarchaeota archaeon]|nr:histidine phosphatase family protein [Nanoarchaeota archaeon]